MSLHQAGSFNDTHNIYDLFDGDRPTQDRRSNMDSNQNVLYAAGLPALISTGITLIYFLLKACHFAFYALSHKTEGRLAAATQRRCQQEQRSIAGEEGHTEVYEQVSGDNTEQYGTGAQRSSGSLPVPRRRKDLRLSSRGDVTEYSEKPAFRQNDKRLPGGRSGSTTNYYGEGPGSTYDDSPGVFTESGGWTNAADGQPSDDERTGGKERRDKDPYDGIQGHRAPKTQVSHVALQTDTCDTLYVTKNTLTAYTIAIVQNSQALQYDQMHTALQTARNEASLETPLRAEELLTAHFNLAVLEDQKTLITALMPRSLQILHKTQNRQLQPPTNRRTSRYLVVTLKIVLQGGHIPQEQLPLPADATTDLSTRYLQVMSLMTLGIICLTTMSIHTHTT